MSIKKETVVFEIIITLFFVFYFFRISSGIFKLADSYEYLSTAQLIKNGNYFFPTSDIQNIELLTKRPFLYPLFLLLTFVSNFKFVLFIQTLFGILNCYIILKCLKKLNITIHAYSFLIFLFTPSIFIYTQLLMSEWLAMTLLMILVYTFLHEFTRNRFILIQVLTLLLAATKPVFFPIIYFNLLYFSIYFFRKKVFTIFLFLPIIFLFGYLQFNHYRTGFTHFSSIENINLIDYNLYYFKSNKESIASADKWRDSVYEASTNYKTYADKNAFFKRTATTEITSNFIDYSWYHFYTSIRGMIDPGRFDLMTFFKKEDGKEGFIEILNSEKSLVSLLDKKHVWIYYLLLPIFIMQVIKFICFGTFIFHNRTKLLSFRLYPICIVILYVLLTGPVNCSRLMMPIQGILIIITFYQMTIFFKKYQNRISDKSVSNQTKLSIT